MAELVFVLDIKPDLTRGPVRWDTGLDGNALHREPGDITMDAFILIITAIAGLIGFDWLALRFGADSRDSIGDDHGTHGRWAAL